MKWTIRLLVILLMILTAGSISLNAQRMGRGMGTDSTRMGMHRMSHMPMHRMMLALDTLKHGRMDRGMGQMQEMPPMWGMRRPFAHGMWPGRGMWMQHYGMMRHGIYGGNGMMQDRGMMIDRIPNLTDKQKKEIADIRQKHRDERQNFRTDMQKKMQDLWDANRKEIMNVLTGDQKKWLEENTKMMPEPPALPKPSSAPEAPKAPVM